MSQSAGSSAVRRRDFLKILGTSAATTAAVGCGRDEIERLIPYTVHPDQTVPGVSTYYATTCRECAAACGVIAETRDGRAIKLEGNPEHPLNRGALCSRGQAALQGAYNPDRYRGPRIRGRDGRLADAKWDDALQLVAQRLAELGQGGRAGGAVFLNEHESGSFPGFLDQWLADLGMPAHLSYDGAGDTAAAAANRQAYGAAWPALRFSAARLIVSVGADFLDTWGPSVPQQLEFAEARARLGGAPRFVYIGARRSLTGLNADEWIPARPGSELAVVQALGGRGPIEAAAQQAGVPAAQLRRLADELRAARPSLVVSGVTTGNAGDVAAAVAQLNQGLGNVGTTIRPAEAVLSYDGVASPAQVADVVRRMAAGQLTALFVRGANPAYSLPKAFGFAAAMARVPFKVSFSSYPDETSELCDVVLPDHHPLEQWGDAQPAAGVIALQQPAMNPVFDTRPTGDVLIDLARRNPQTVGRYPTGDYRAWLFARLGGAAALTEALPRGLMAGALAPRAGVPVGAAPALAPIDQTQGDFYLVVFPHSMLGDGRGANKPWLQEIADPVSKVAWQTWVEIHPRTAARLGVEKGDVVRIETDAGAIEAPAFIYLGVREDTVAVPLGQGHTAYGRYAAGTGVNALDAVPVRNGVFALTATKARVRKTGAHVPLVTIEGAARQHGRGIGRAVNASDLRGGAALVPAPGEENADEIAPTGSGGAQGAPGQSDAHGGDSVAAGSEGTSRAMPGAQGGEHGAAPGAGEHHNVPGAPSTQFLPGLRAPVAADAQGDFLDSTSKDRGMYDPRHWSGMANRRWAMTIDLARCTGCSACVTACYAENNIPTVGAAYQARNTPGVPGTPGANILRSREMNWIRIERYYEGGEDGGADFETRFVPMLCQHCGNAPCEPVCPVYATYHAPDGLNVQVYNRCVGTRYCSNNCPYKVRYFNWFGYGEPERPQYAWPEPMHQMLNPDVTVRGKGVMEKCTFCVQRIREAENRARLEGRDVRPDEFTTACSAACPSRAILFGDAADPRWAMTRGINDERAYHVFEELNTYTAVVYLKKVNHPAPAAPAAREG
ncbi:MAG TPA: 4Fe-4S dicluster domain-containing protein [Gemmatimonadaceae bacterium]|nr:4Fe-4S dicluster domain-containing protein [Gemmatimonadaceae bacterium]